MQLEFICTIGLTQMEQKMEIIPYFIKGNRNQEEIEIKIFKAI